MHVWAWVYGRGRTCDCIHVCTGLLNDHFQVGVLKLGSPFQRHRLELSFDKNLVSHAEQVDSVSTASSRGHQPCGQSKGWLQQFVFDAHY